MNHQKNNEYELDRYFNDLVRLAQTKSNPFVASIIDLKQEKTLATGWYEGPADIAAHSEIVAIRELFAKHPDLDRSKLLLCTTAEPCPMCSAALVYAATGVESI